MAMMVFLSPGIRCNHTMQLESVSNFYSVNLSKKNLSRSVDLTPSSFAAADRGSAKYANIAVMFNFNDAAVFETEVATLICTSQKVTLWFGMF
jgi:hypothetical protein